MTSPLHDQPQRLFLLIVLAIVIGNLVLPGEKHIIMAMITTIVVFGLALSYFCLFRQNVLSVPLVALFILLMLALAAGIIGSYQFTSSLRQASYFIMLFLLAWLVSEFRHSLYDLRLVAWTIVIAAVGLSLYGFLQIVTFFAQQVDAEMMRRIVPVSSNYLELVYSQKRIFSTFALPTSFSVFLAAAVPFALGLIFYERRFWARFLAVAATVILLLAMVQTKSHGGLASLMAGAAVVTVLLLRDRGWNWKKVGFAAAGCVVAVLGLIIAVGAIRGNFLWNLEHFNSPIRLRWMLWMAGMDIFLANPLTGIGGGNFDLGLFPHINEAVRPAQHAHNTYLQMGVEWGILGIVFVLSLLSAVVYRIGKILARPGRHSWLQYSLIASVVVMAAANSIEIGVYFYSLGIFAAVLLGLLFRPETTDEERPIRSPRWALVLAVLAGSGFILINCAWFIGDEIYASSRLSVQMAVPQEDFDTLESVEGLEATLLNAREMMNVAAAVNGGDPDYFAFMSELNRLLARGSSPAAADFQRTAAVKAEKAVMLSPRDPTLRYLYAHSLIRNRRFLEAGHQAQLAAEWFPWNRDFAVLAAELNEGNENTMRNGMRRRGGNE